MRRSEAYPTDWLKAELHLCENGKPSRTLALTIKAVKVLRQEFVALHSNPLLSSLREQFHMRYPDVEFPDPPVAGGFEIERVLESAYFFS